MSDPHLPPGPWRWVPAGVPASGRGRGLLASDGTWVIHAYMDAGLGAVHPAAGPLLAQAHVLRRLPNVLALWEDFRDAETPIAQASALMEFANAMAHLGWDFNGELDDPADDAPDNGGSGPSAGGPYPWEQP